MALSRSCSRAAEGLRISVVLPTFRRPKACEEAVLSALAQTLPPLEVLVCDDGSGDETQEVVERLARKDPRVRYVGGERSGLPAVPRNRGVWLARGEWLAFLDDDDLWLPTKLERQSKYLEERVVVSANACRTSGGVYFPPSPVRRVQRRELVRDNPIIASSALVRRHDVLSVGGFRTGVAERGIEDYVLWLDLADDGASFVLIPEPLVIYCDAGERLSGERLAQQQRVASHMARRWLCHPADPDLAISAVTQALRFVKLVIRRALDRLGPFRRGSRTRE